MDSAEIWDAGWHCSSCFSTIAEMRAKMESFSHTPLNTPENRDPVSIMNRVRAGLDLFGRKGEVYERVDGNEDVPRYVKYDSERFGYLLNRDGEDAGFSDWESVKQEAGG